MHSVNNLVKWNMHDTYIIFIIYLPGIEIISILGP